MLPSSWASASAHCPTTWPNIGSTDPFALTADSEGGTVIRTQIRVALIVVAALCCPPAASAQDDAVLIPAEPDFTIINLPTSLRMPLFGSAIRVTHRFTRPLKCDE